MEEYSHAMVICLFTNILVLRKYLLCWTLAYTFKITPHLEIFTCNGYMPFYQYYGFTQVFFMLDVGLRLQDHPPPRNGGMAMAIPMTTLEDGLQDEARKNDKYNPHWILVYCNEQ